MGWVIWPIAIVFFDQLTKFFAPRLEELPGGTLPVIPDVFHLTYVRNTGAAFSMLSGRQWVLIPLTCVVALIILILLIVKGKKMPALVKYPLAWVLGGAIGNLIDRIRFSYVVDFFDFRLINFAVFNLADYFLCCGAILLGIYIVFIEGRIKRDVL